MTTPNGGGGPGGAAGTGPGGPQGPIDPVRAAENNLAAVLAPLTIVHFLAVTVVLLRLYTRVFIIKSPGRDDWVMLAAIICAVVGWILFVLMGTSAGLGRHWDTLSPETQNTHALLSFLMSLISTTAAIALLKISIVLNLLRLSTNKWYRISLWATLCLIVAYQFMGAMTWFLRCIPMKRIWDKSVPGECYDIKLFVTFAVVNTAFNIATDVMCATFPIPIIWGLQMKRKTRFYLIGVLSLGYAAVGLGIAKAVYQIGFGSNQDKTFNSWVTFWGFLQLNVGIIAACAPSLKPLVSRALGLSTADSRAYGNTYGSRGPGRGRNASGVGNVSGLRLKTRDHYELHDMDEEENRIKRGHTDTTVTTFYKSNSEGERSGSEELILNEQGHGFKGIVRTTEVVVK
ncbi:integral membrane protein [Sarocladium implicatum]|nr:integral membrane protein [Sarocladium implicatum]